jgi:glycosyltransferase involved in cell wall biosynthesis
VELVGAVPYAAVPVHLAQMDVGVAPYPALSSFYFSPLKIFEYAAAGVPIAASESGQIAELLAHRVTAMLHPPGSTTKLVRHIEELRARPELRARLARRARTAVAKPHTWDRLAARLLSIAEHT